MKKFFSDFFLRGLLTAGGGPVVLAIIYGILGATGTVETFSPGDVCVGIISITLLALICGGMTAIYQQERLPRASAILIHGGVLYLGYLVVYLLNGWLAKGWLPLAVFSGIFIVSYAIIWGIIFLFTRRDAQKLTQQLPKA